MSSYEEKRAELKRDALAYHEFPTPGKVAIAATKPLSNQRDLALALEPRGSSRPGGGQATASGELHDDCLFVG